MANVTVLKLGGALLTDKARVESVRDGVVTAVAREIAGCLADGLLDQLILVHGVGAFGHPPVVKHKLHKGFQSPDQLLPLARTQTGVMRLRLLLAEALQDARVPVCLMLPSSMMTTRAFHKVAQFLDAVAGFIRLGMVPLLGGDVLPDAENGFAVYSGDRLAVDLALAFQAQRLLFASAVDGVYTRDPEAFPDAAPVPEISLQRQLSGEASIRLDAHRAVDASGAMAGKLQALRPAATAVAAGMETRIFSMLENGRLRTLLAGNEPVGTQMVA